MVTIKVVGSRPEAEIIKSILEANGIPVLIFADDQGGMRPSMSFAQGVEIKVNDIDAYKARDILSNMEEDSNE
jgi:hypothetical protein